MKKILNRPKYPYLIIFSSFLFIGIFLYISRTPVTDLSPVSDRQNFFFHISTKEDRIYPTPVVGVDVGRRRDFVRIQNGL